VLYTREFYQSVKASLKPGGIFMQWLPTHRVSVMEYKIILRTFQSVFPHTSVWLVSGFDENGSMFTTTLLLATPQRLSIDVARLRRRLSEPAVRRDLEPWDLHQPVGVLECFLCGEDRAREWTRGAPINTDDLPYTQYMTAFSKGPMCDPTVFAGLLESVWPYLTNTGDAAASRRLREELDRHRAAWRAYLSGHLSRAFAMLPDSGKMQRIRQNIESGGRYWDRLVSLYGPP